MSRAQNRLNLRRWEERGEQAWLESITEGGRGGGLLDCKNCRRSIGILGGREKEEDSGAAEGEEERAWGRGANGFHVAYAARPPVVVEFCLPPSSHLPTHCLHGCWLSLSQFAFVSATEHSTLRVFVSCWYVARIHRQAKSKFNFIACS